MTTVIRRIGPHEAADLVGDVAYPKGEINRHLLSTTHIEAGYVDGILVAIWGLIPPTIVSNQAYIWVYTTAGLEGHEFIFVRQSQKVVKKFLEEYDTIVGVTEVGEDRSIRWLKWLGAEYGVPQGKWKPFVIRRK